MNQEMIDCIQLKMKILDLNKSWNPRVIEKMLEDVYKDFAFVGTHRKISYQTNKISYQPTGE